MPELRQAIHMEKEMGNDVGPGEILQRKMQEDQISKSLERTKPFKKCSATELKNTFDLFSDE